MPIDAANPVPPTYPRLVGMDQVPAHVPQDLIRSVGITYSPEFPAAFTFPTSLWVTPVRITPTSKVLPNIEPLFLCRRTIVMRRLRWSNPRHRRPLAPNPHPPAAG